MERSVLITGVAQGVGRYLALELIREDDAWRVEEDKIPFSF